jgi:hypothetical protein
VHAAIEFAFAYPQLAGSWHDSSNTLAILAVPDEIGLIWLCADISAAGLRVVRFSEPDLDGAITAAAFEPAANRLLARLPLALAQRREVKS